MEAKEATGFSERGECVAESSPESELEAATGEGDGGGQEEEVSQALKEERVVISSC